MQCNAFIDEWGCQAFDAVNRGGNMAKPREGESNSTNSSPRVPHGNSVLFGELGPYLTS